MNSSTREKNAVMAAAIVLVAVVGWIDYGTNNELELFLFYSIPISLAAWYLGRTPVICLCLACTAIWFVIGVVTGQAYSSVFYRCWKTGIVLTSFLANGLTLQKIQQARSQVAALTEELVRTRAKLEAAKQRQPATPEFAHEDSEGVR